MRGNLHPVLSRPLKVLWAGWESDTYSLQQAGWELSAEQDAMMRYMRVALRHKDMQCIAVSSGIEFDYWDSAQIGGRPLPPLVIQYFGTRLVVNVMDTRVMAFEPIDAAPQFLSHNREVHGWDDMKWFAAPLVRTEEIIVEPDTVQRMLDTIREMQAPEQAALRAKRRLTADRTGMGIEGQPRQQFHAQILSIAA